MAYFFVIIFMRDIMSVIMNYLVSMFPYIAYVLPIYGIIRIIYIKYKKKMIDWYHEIILLLYVMFIIGLLSLTIIPKNSNRTHEINLIPFKIFKDIYYEIVVNRNITYLWINLVGNICIFIPIGLFPLILWKVKVGKVIIGGCLLSLFIEISQMFLARATDIDDLILNTIGVIIGVVIFNMLHKYNNEKKEK